MKTEYRKLLVNYDQNIHIQDACAVAGLVFCRSMLFANATLVVAAVRHQSPREHGYAATQLRGSIFVVI